MRILLTNATLRYRAGTELYVRDVALRLRRLGHDPVCFSMEHGEIADEIRAGGVAVVDRLEAVGPAPEVIHGHHLLETTIAALYFPEVPVLSICHGAKAWQESPCRVPGIWRHVAVSEACRKRLVDEAGIRPEKVEVLLNFVDLERFRPRPALPERPRRALVFSNYAREETSLPVVREACRRAGLALEVAGSGSGSPCARPEELLPQYDLVFGKARCAIEALAVGCAVVQCDFFGVGRMVTSGNVDELRKHNFGFGSMDRPLEVESLLGEIERYDAADAAAVSARLRAEAGLDQAVERLCLWYRAAIAEGVSPGESPSAFASRFIREQAEWIRLGRDSAGRVREAEATSAKLKAAHDVYGQANRALADAHRGSEEARQRAETELAALREALAVARARIKEKAKETKMERALPNPTREGT